MPTAEPAFKFGVWLELPPDTPLAGQGIIRLLAVLLRAVERRPDAKVVLALPGWTVEPLREVLGLEGVNLEAVEFVVSRRTIPLLVRLRRFLRTRRPRSTRDRGRLWQRLARRMWGWQPVRRVARPLLATGSPLVAALAVVVATLVSLPLLLVALPIALLARQVRRSRLVQAVRNRLAGPGADRGAGRVPLHPSLAAIAEFLGSEVMAFELERLTRRCQARRDIAAWLVPFPGSVHAAGLHAPLVVAVPDLVYVDFPTRFPPAAVEILDAKVRTLAKRAAAMVSYCEHVRSSHVVRHLGVAPERAHVIVNAPMQAPTGISANPPPDVRTAAAAVLANHFRRHSQQDAEFPPGSEYLVDFPFAEVDFLFVSSQVRPHKNYLNLMRAFALLLRRKRMPVKLFFTGRWADDTAGMRELASTQRLWLDVVSVPDLPPDVHEAFYRLAAVTVVPTLFEGGFPFPFGESMSVGTPVVMSSIPVTREVVPPDLAPLMLFDPYDPGDIAEKMAWALDHRQELAERQQALYDNLRHRTWNDVAQEYLMLLQQVAEATPPLGAAAATQRQLTGASLT